MVVSRNNSVRRNLKTGSGLDFGLVTRKVAKSFGRPPAGLTREAREALLTHDWPGNVRELRNALERAAILCEGGLISAQHLSLYTPPRPVAATTDLNSVEQETIDAADALGIDMIKR
jgi:DNA-binding NtrC family response regulator